MKKGFVFAVLLTGCACVAWFYGFRTCAKPRHEQEMKREATPAVMVNDDLGITMKPFSEYPFVVPEAWLAAQSAFVKEAVRKGDFETREDDTVGVLDEKGQFQTWPGAPKFVRADAQGHINLGR